MVYSHFTVDANYQTCQVTCGLHTVHVYIRAALRQNNIGNVSTTQQWGAFVQPLLQRRNNNYYIFWVCVCSLSYPACNANAPYYIIVCGLWGSCILFHIISQAVRFGREKILNVRRNVLIPSVTFVWKAHSEKSWARFFFINLYRSSCKVPVILVTF